MWFTIAIISFFLLAIAAIIDKFLLTKSRIVPISYAFHISVIGGVISSLLIFFEKDFYFPKEHLSILLIGGVSIYFAIYLLFKAVAKSEISKVNPLIVSITPLIIFVFSYLLSLKTVTFYQFIGILLIVIGSYLLSQVGHAKTKIKPKVWLFIIGAGLMFAISNSFNKLAYNEMSFLTAFIYLRWFSLLGAIIFTFIVGGWKKIINLKEKDESKTKQRWLAFALGQVAGGLGIILMQYAIAIANVILVTALNGVQFLFIIVIVYLLSKFKPEIYRENISTRYILPKLMYSILLFLGIYLILI